MNDLSGERNVVLGCLAMGMTRAEVKAQAAGDHRVLRHQRAGRLQLACRCGRTPPAWRARLRFSIAAAKKHDVLLIDEALATGDAQFRRRSEQRVRELRDERRHGLPGQPQLASIRDTCERTIWLESGVLRMDGPTDEVLQAYEAYANSK